MSDQSATEESNVVRVNHAHPQCANPECRSLETVGQFNQIQCLRCGRLTFMKTGELVPLEVQQSPSDGAAWYKERE